METRRWTNPSQPQTMQIAVFLLYANAVFGLLFGLPFALFGVLGFLAVVAYVAGGLGIANERKWGYNVAVGVSVLVVLATVVRFGLSLGNILSLIFDLALVALLLHPQSRDYQRVWFS